VFKAGDLDREFARFEASQAFDLLDVGAVFFAGPFGLLVTKGYDFSTIARGTEGSGDIRTLVSDWKVEGGVARAQDVAMATNENRIALQGGLDLVNDRFDDVTIALIDAKGCVKVRQRLRGWPWAHAAAVSAKAHRAGSSSFSFTDRGGITNRLIVSDFAPLFVSAGPTLSCRSALGPQQSDVHVSSCRHAQRLLDRSQTMCASLRHALCWRDGIQSRMRTKRLRRQWIERWVRNSTSAMAMPTACAPRCSGGCIGRRPPRW
jgi:hypothetical protein